jgi:hypothetical protein
MAKSGRGVWTMARGDRKKGRENKKQPKQAALKSDAKSAYQMRQNETVASTPFKVKKK